MESGEEFDFDRKVVVLLDKSSALGRSSNVTFKIALKDGMVKTPQPVPKITGSITKSIWTWCIESMFEVHRVISDLFIKKDRLIRLAVAGSDPQLIEEEWASEMPSMEKLMDLMIEVGCPPATGEEISVLKGLPFALKALSELDAKQKVDVARRRRDREEAMRNRSDVEHYTFQLEGKDEKEDNRGTLIIFTACQTDDQLSELELKLGEMIEQHNSQEDVRSTTSLPISGLNVLFVNFYPGSTECLVTTRPLTKHELFPFMNTYVISRVCTEMKNVAHSVALVAYNLMSTTVTKIPMKEENSSSMNYDVELLHPRPVHKLLDQLGIIKKTSSKAGSTSGVTYETTKLAWATLPKNRHIYLHFPKTLSTAPCTPAEANSRPSACLTNFVMDGRSVMLDLEKAGPVAEFRPNVNNNLISHTLMKHSGRIYIHTINFLCQEKDFEQPTFGLTVKPGEFRVKEMRKILQRVRLKKARGKRLQAVNNLPASWKSLPCGQPRRILHRITRNFTTQTKRTFIFQGDIIERNFEPLHKHMQLLKLTDKQVEECLNNIRLLHTYREQKKAFALPTEKINTVLVNDMSDKEEQLRVGLAEFARFLVAYANFSSRHTEVFKAYMQMLGLDRMLNLSCSDVLPPVVQLPDEDDESFKKKDSETDDEDGGAQSKGDELSSHSVSPVQNKVSRLAPAFHWRPNETVSVMEMMCSNLERSVNERKREFVGIEPPGKIARLYVNLNQAPGTPPGAGATTRPIPI